MSDINLKNDFDFGVRSVEKSFLIINPNSENIPMHYQEDESLIKNLTGAFYEGITNFGYFLSDAGLMGVLGINKLEFNNSKQKIWLFYEKFTGEQQSKFMCEFRKLIW